MAEMVKLKYDNKVYELTYTRETVKRMEAAGFDIQAFAQGTKPVTMSYMLFEGAFAARNRNVKRNVIEAIYSHLDRKADLLVALAELYTATLETLVDSAAESDGKNVTWEAV